MTRDALSHTLAVTVIGGYLGAGKTTLVNHLLREAARRPDDDDAGRIAVLVNDFGDIAIDAALVESRDDEVISLAGGCVCCSFGSDLVGTLARLRRLPSPPRRAIVEASGVALPRAIARSVVLAPGVELDAVIVLADAQSVRERARDRFVGDTVLAQLRDADLLVLNKVDAGADAGLRAWLADVAPRAQCVEASYARVPFELVVGPRYAAAQRGAPRRRTFAAAAPVRGRAMRPLRDDASRLFERLALPVPPGVDPAALAAAFSRPGLGLARAKGFVTDRHGGIWLVQAVGRRVEVSRWVRADPADAAAGNTLVCLGARGELDREAIAAAVDRVARGVGTDAGTGTGTDAGTDTGKNPT